MQSLLHLLLLLAMTAIAAQGADTTTSEVPQQALLVGPLRPLHIGSAPAIRGQRGNAGAVLATVPPQPILIAPLVPRVTRYSNDNMKLYNNITISQSRVVLSHLDQLFLLSKLVDTIDLAPKLASSTTKMSATSDTSNTNAANEAATTMTTKSTSDAAQGFLFVPTTTRVSDADVALINILGTTLGFGWRYPLAYWNQLAATDKPTCAFAKAAGAFFYC